MQCNLHKLSVTDILKLSKNIKEKCSALSYVDDVAQEISKILYESFTTDGGKNPFALVRFFITCSHDQLPEDIRAYLQRKEQKNIFSPGDTYLTLMGTYGDREEWRNRKDSKNYQAFSLSDPQFHAKFPMISAVFRQIGIEILAGSQLDMSILIKERHKRLGFFCVENAVGNKLIPKQSEFVEQFAIQSAFGFGGIYPTGNAYIIIIFSREKVTKEYSRLFLSLNPAIKWSSLEHEASGNIFKTSALSPHAPNIFRHTGTEKDILPTHDALSSQKQPIDIEKGKTTALIEELEITNEYLIQTTEELSTSHTMIRSGEEKLRKITESAFDAIIIIDSHGAINFWNGAAETMFGYKRGEVLGKDVHKVIVPETYYDSYLTGFSHFRKTGTGALIGKKIMLPAIKKDGTEFYAEHSFAAFGTNGSWSAVSIIRDCTEQIQKQNTLIKNELILKTAQKIAHLGCWEWNITDNSETWSDEQFRIFGYEPEEVEATYDLFLNALHPEDKEKVLKAVHNAFYNNIPYSTEFRIIRPDNTIRTVHSQGNIFRDANGIPLRMIGTMLDITERKLTEARLRELNESLDLLVKERTKELEEKNELFLREIINRRKIENALRESENRFRAMIEQAAVGVALIETKTDHFVLLNKKYCDIVGYTIEEMCKMTFREITHPEDLPEDLNNMQKLIKGNIRDFSMEKRYIHKNGSIVWVNLTVSAMWEKGETPDFHIAIVEDITERKQMEEKLKKLSLAVEQSVCTIVITDKEGTIQYVNPKFTDVTGYTYKEAIGQNPRILKSGKTPDEEYKKLWDRITSGNSWQGEFYNKKKNGDYFWELAEISPIKDRNGNITNYLAIKEDITEKKKKEEEQIQLKEQLFHAQRLESIGRLSGGIAHDFNNFLMAISGYTNLLQLMSHGNEKALGYLHNIHIATEKAARLTKNLLAFSKKQVIQSKPENMNTIINEITPLIRQLMGEDINCITGSPNNKLIVTVDKLQIEQVLMNLATNARDAMPEGGTFTIQTFVEHIDDVFIAAKGFGIKGTYAAVSISDTGTGMDEETKAKIFEPFFTTKGADKGTGLGLSTTYGIVKQHNGYIDVSTKKGAGTTFTLYFPLNTLSQEEATQPSATGAVLTKGSETILVAEDDESVRILIKEVLERFGYTVIAASDGEDAIQKYKQNADVLKLLILDVKMPKKDGKKVYDEVMLANPEMKIIFLSGYTDSIIPQDVMQNNNVHFIQKPVLPTKLVKQVNDILK
ncbi:MAG: PAS domain S-box protein [Planctomycetes bacterium]|nr:PAS domain S-box protein [Planctomycetota bacterium]